MTKFALKESIDQLNLCAHGQDSWLKQVTNQNAACHHVLSHADSQPSDCSTLLKIISYCRAEQVLQMAQWASISAPYLMFIYGATWTEYMRRARRRVQPRRRSAGAAEAPRQQKWDRIQLSDECSAFSDIHWWLSEDELMQHNGKHAAVPVPSKRNISIRYFVLLFFRQCQSLIKGVRLVISIRPAVMCIMGDEWKHVLVLKINTFFMAKNKKLKNWVWKGSQKRKSLIAHHIDIYERKYISSTYIWDSNRAKSWPVRSCRDVIVHEGGKKKRYKNNNNKLWELLFSLLLARAARQLEK